MISCIYLTIVHLLFLLHVIVPAILNTELIHEYYWKNRAEFLREEREIAFGGKLQLNDNERLANDVLMTHKRKEIDDAFEDPEKFLPGKNFLEVKNDIEKSEVFKIIKKMPKGAVLHSHDTAIVSEDWLYNNITYRDSVYVCDENNTLQLRFFKNPSNDCKWQLLSDIRKNIILAEDINTRIRKKISMATDNPIQDYPTVNDAWNKFSSIFAFITPLLTYRPVYEDHFYQGLKELYDDNVFYLELRTTLPPLYELNGREYNPIEVLGIYKEVAGRFMDDHPDFIGVKIIFAPIKLGVTPEILQQLNLTLEMSRNYPNFFAGLDLVGQEDPAAPLIEYIPVFSHLINKVNFFFHAGETNWYGLASDENLIDAILLNTTRIGHGYAVVKHPKVLEIVKQRNIAIEVCPISNQVLGLVKDLRNHPANILFAYDYPVVVSNDDPGLWGSRALSYDFYEAFMGMMSKEADIRALKQLAINSIYHSCMSDDQRTKAYAVWSKKWSQFIDKIYSKDFTIKRL